MYSGRRLRIKDRALIEAARNVLRRGFHGKRCSVAAAVRSKSGHVYLGRDVEGTILSCRGAELIAISVALNAGECIKDLESMVAVAREQGRYPVLSHCGTCREILWDWTPGAEVLVRFPSGRVARLTKKRASRALLWRLRMTEFG